jgi:phytoene dehydrogenase-like protein
VTRYDVLFLGTSSNALAAAARLARAGLSVLLLDTRPAAGGPVTTAGFGAPGFLADIGLPSAALDPEIAADLGLSLDWIRRDTVTSLGAAPLTLREEPSLPAAVGHAVELIRALHRMDPPNMPVPAEADAASLQALSGELRGLGARDMHEVLRLLSLPVRDFLREIAGDHALFQSPAARGLLAGLAVRGLSEGPFAQGTLWNALCLMALGEGLFRSTLRGGTGKLADALCHVAVAAGAQVRTSVPGPIRVDVEDGVARGVILGDGERLSAGAVVSDFDVRFTFTRLVSPADLPPEVNREVRCIRYRGSVARVHFALSGLPSFTGLDADALRGTLVLAPDVESLEKAWDQAKRGTVPEHPYIEATLPSVADPTLAPQGSHVLDAWVQFVPHGRGDREALSRSVLSHLAAFAPDLPSLVLHTSVLLPEDLESRFLLTEGHLYGGENRLEQSFFQRSLPDCPHYGSPIESLYLAGSGAHPMGYGGRSGWNLARRLLDGRMAREAG